MNFARKISQLFFDFGSQPPWKPADGSLFERSTEPSSARQEEPIKELTTDESLTQTCRELLIKLDMPGMAKVVQVFWNPRLRSTAGYASYPSWRIELNPRLREFEGQTERTLRHELAHLVAYHRAGRRSLRAHREGQVTPGERCQA